MCKEVQVEIRGTAGVGWGGVGGYIVHASIFCRYICCSGLHHNAQHDVRCLDLHRMRIMVYAVQICIHHYDV